MNKNVILLLPPFATVLVVAGLSALLSSSEARARQHYESRQRSNRQQTEAHQYWQQEQQAELHKIFGETPEDTLKKPGLNLTATLRQLALQCSPKNSTVQVDVENFTEFNVTVTLPAPSSALELVPACKCFLSRASTYVHSIRFISDKKTVASLDRWRMESVTDWNSLPDSTLAAYLTSQSADLNGDESNH